MKHLRKTDAAQSLKSELQIDRVPPAIEQKLRQVYAELPMEMPTTYSTTARSRASDGYEEVEAVTVKRLPWPLRTGFAACGALALAFVLLLGLNFTHPEFTESLPGLGGIFEKVNGKNPIGTNLGTYDDLEQVSQAALAETDSGYSLTVDEAFCDGENVYFTVEIASPAGAPAYDVLIPASEDGYNLPTSVKAPIFKINGADADPVSSGSASTEDGKTGIAYTLPLPAPAENGSVLDVTLQVDYLKVGYEKQSFSDMETIPVDFKVGFPVTVNTKHNHISIGKGQDNGVSVQEVESTPGYIKLKLETPIWGYEGEEEMKVGGTPKGGPYHCHLYTEDGQELDRNSSLIEMDSRLVTGGPNPIYPNKGTMINYTVGFNGAPAGCKKVKLRIFELDLGSALMAKPETMEPGYIHDLFAEFTIDLETGNAEPTDTYLQEGMKKLDSEEYINTPHTPLFTNGYLVADKYIGPDYTGWDRDIEEGWSYTVGMYADTEEVPDLTMRFLHNGEQIGEVKTRTLEECTQPYAEEFGNYDSYEYKQEDGSRFRISSKFVYFTEEQLETLGFQTIPKWQMSFIMHRPESYSEVFNAPIEDYDVTIQVIDNKTGQVILDNPLMYTTWVPKPADTAEARNPADGPTGSADVPGGVVSSPIAEQPTPQAGTQSKP